MKRTPLLTLCFAANLLAATLLAATLLDGCSAKQATEQKTGQPAEAKKEPVPAVFTVDPATAGTLSGHIRYTGKRPAPQSNRYERGTCLC